MAVGELGDAVLVPFAFAALTTVGREIVKDVEDIGSDREERLNTLPIAIGERRALLVALIVLALAVIVSPLPYLRGTFGIVYLILVIPCDALMLYSAQRGFTDPTVSQSCLKYSMYLAAVAFVVGRAYTLLS